MNCGDFERSLNDGMDARDASPPGLTEVTEAHAAVCPPCRKLAARYLALNRAVRRAVPPPDLPPGFADRVLAASAREGRPVAGRVAPRLALLAAAAGVAAVALGLLWRQAEPGPAEANPAAVARVHAIDPDDLADALADARSATWTLAREASAPAARVGRQILDASESPRPSPAFVLPAGVGPAVEVWRGVGERVHAGVRPLEGSARHAFGFLLGDSPEEDRPAPRPAEGA